MWARSLSVPIVFPISTNTSPSPTLIRAQHAAHHLRRPDVRAQHVADLAQHVAHLALHVANHLADAVPDVVSDHLADAIPDNLAQHVE